MLELKMFRSKAAGLPDLLNYAALWDEGIIKGKDGSLMAGFFFRGEDAAVSTPAERNYITQMVNNYLARFGSGWAMWVDAARLSSPGYPAPELSHFPEPITAMIDAERRAMFEQDDALFETEYALILQFLPPPLRETRLKELFYNSKMEKESEIDKKILEYFKRRLLDFESGLGDLLHMRRMGTKKVIAPDGEEYLSDELVNYLHFTLTGEALALRIPDCPMYLDAWLGAKELRPGEPTKLGDKFVTCVAIDGFPGSTAPGILDMLDGLPIQYRWTSRFIFLDQHEAIAALRRYHLKWQQKIRGFWSQVFKTQKGIVNMDAVLMKNETEQALSEAESGLVAYGYYTPVVVIMHKSRAVIEEQARYVLREIERRGFAARIETVNCLEAWLGTLPGHTYPNVRRPLIHTLNLSDLMPLSSVWPGLRENPCNFYPQGSPPLMHTVTRGGTPFRLNLHVGDVGHTLIFGPTGAGKSTLLATLLAQARRYRGRPRRDGPPLPMTITAFDKGRSLYALCSATGGRHYDIGSDKHTLRLAPLQSITTDNGMMWAEEFIATCFELKTKRPPMPEEIAAIHKAMLLLRELPSYQRTFTGFYTLVQSDSVKQAIEFYTMNGTTNGLLDGHEDDVSISSFTVFEIDELMKSGDTIAIPILLYLFRQFETALKGQPAILSLDEAWVMLGHGVFRERLRSWLKELRKKNCLVLLATQSLSDAVSSGLLDVLVEQCPTKIFLPNKEADLSGTSENPGPAELYKTFGLNDLEIQVLKGSQYKRHYYYRSPLGKRLFELGLGPLALSFVAVSDPETLAEVEYLQTVHGADWPLYWLEKRGVEYEQYVQK